jgi:hypothetical protein
MIFPSHKDKKNMYNDDQKKEAPGTKPQTAGNNNSMYVKRNDLEKIIEQETKRRVGTAEQQFGQ